jgi:hypothetical protein
VHVLAGHPAGVPRRLRLTGDLQQGVDHEFRLGDHQVVTGATSTPSMIW